VNFSLWPVFRCLLCCIALTTSFAQQNSSSDLDATLPQAPSATPQVQPSQSPPALTQPSPNQSSQAQPSPDQWSQNQGQKAKKNKREGVSKDRLFYALPNFLTLENSANLPPLSSKEKFKVVAKGSFDYVQIPWYAFLAGISQAEDSEQGYGQGAAGYGKRFGAYLADGTIENFMTGAILPTVLGQDPRYFQLGRGSFFHRSGYAVSRIFVTRTDSGHQAFNVSEVVGSALSAGISTYSYHPREDRNVRNALTVWGAQVGYDTITLVVKEFWPDIRHKISKNKALRP
jgi:hypothetical protein